MARIRLDRLDLKPKMASKELYEAEQEKLQLKMLSIQQCYYHERRRAILVFEGWDAAGKGGAIRRLTETLDPRGFHVWPIGPPAPSEQGRHYLYRFWIRLPEPGQLAIFDRSWYGRVLVERVERLAPPDARKRAYREINEFERMLVDDGVRIVKLFLHISPEEQLKRFAERLDNPYKRWKLTPSDIEMHLKWAAYVEAAEDMFDRTSTSTAPWHVIPAEHKWYGRVRVMETVTAALARGVDLRPPPIDPALKRAALRLLGRVRKTAKR